MVFSSYTFLIFLITVVAVFCLLKYCRLIALSQWMLLAASLVFYAWWKLEYLPILLGSILINFGLSKLMILSNPGLIGKKPILIVGITFNILLLGVYKYTDFILENLNLVIPNNIPLPGFILPLALSFFTFQQIAFLVDTCKGETKGYNFLSYGLFVAFFPQLVAGPIVHHKKMVLQFENNGLNSQINYESIFKGLILFIIGLSKKVIIADNLGILVDSGYSSVETLNFLQSWVTTLSYTLQLYFDFSGYSDMAIGIALMFNIQLPVNFNSPYRAINIQEFWRRWHMTLSQFLSQYIYQPLGGNRIGKLRNYLNLLIVFLIGGIWHGAGWTFIVWGAMHALASIFIRYWWKLNIQLPRTLAILLTFSFIHMTWIPFKADDFNSAITMFQNLWDVNFTLLSPQDIIQNLKSLGVDKDSTMEALCHLGLILGALISVFIVPNSLKLMKRYEVKSSFFQTLAVALLFCLCLILINSSSPAKFLYFDF